MRDGVVGREDAEGETPPPPPLWNPGYTSGESRPFTGYPQLITGVFYTTSGLGVLDPYAGMNLRPSNVCINEVYFNITSSHPG